MVARIRELNDAFRTVFAGDERVFVTAGIAAMSPEQQVEIMRRVHGFVAFTPDTAQPWCRVRGGLALPGPS
jgi:hypothetical protein